MDKARSKLMKDSFEESKRENHVSKGGGSDYKMQRSKFVKDKQGYGLPVTAAREALYRRFGHKVPSNVVASHIEGGRHKEKDGGAFRVETLAQNTARSNVERMKDKSKIRQRLKELGLKD